MTPRRQGQPFACLLEENTTLRAELDQARRTATNLQAALTSRIIIEQAKGVLAQRLGITVDRAFVLLHKHARDHNLKLPDLCGRVVNDRFAPCTPPPPTRDAA